MDVVHTYEGTDTIQALIVGRDLTGISHSAEPLPWPLNAAVNCGPFGLTLMRQATMAL
jgi:hypothetical protein